MKARTTIREVAAAAGVSITTVSNFLNGNYKNMSSQTRDRVADAVHELNYYPSLGAQSLPRKRRTHTICIAIPHDVDYTFHHPYFAGVMRGISSVIDPDEYQTMILTTRDKSQKEIAYLRGLLHGLVDGIIFFDVEAEDPFVSEFSRTKAPVMFVGSTPELTSRFVDNDIEDGAAQAVNHLVGIGHRSIALINGPPELTFTEQLTKGYRKALSEAHLSFAEERVAYGAFTEEGGLDAAERLFDEEEPPTAVFVASGRQTTGALEAAKRRNLAIPGDLSVVSFGHHPVSTMQGLRLSYLDQPELEVGARVAERLLSQIETRNFEQSPDVLPLTLVEGESTSPPGNFDLDGS
jgi:LacI family transcriptional regulator